MKKKSAHNDVYKNLDKFKRFLNDQISDQNSKIRDREREIEDIHSKYSNTFQADTCQGISGKQNSIDSNKKIIDKLEYVRKRASKFFNLLQ